MNDIESLEQLLTTLKVIHAAIRDTAEPSIIEQLEEAICQIQLLIENSNCSDEQHTKALAYLDLLLKHLPSIALSISRFLSG